MKIALLSLHLGDDFKAKTKYGRINKLKYCNKHGYDFIDDDSVYDPTRAYTWSKILLIKKYLSSYDYVLWMDADGYIMNMDISIEKDLVPLCQNKDILVTTHGNQPIAGGAILCKNTPFVLSFLDTVYGNLPDAQYHEQSSLADCYERDVDGCRNHIEILPHSQQHLLFSAWFFLKKGHFAFQCVGATGCGMLEGQMNDFCPMRMDSDTDESFKKRMDHLRDRYGIEAFE